MTILDAEMALPPTLMPVLAWRAPMAPGARPVLVASTAPAVGCSLEPPTDASAGVSPLANVEP